LVLTGGLDLSGAKVGALADGVFPGRGALVTGLAGAADCGRKLCVPERAGLAAGLLEAGLGLLLTAGRDVGRDEAGLAVGELEAVGDDGGVSPGVPGRAELPPLATARAAAASAGLEAPRTGAAGLFDGGGVAIVGPEAEAAGRTLLDCDDELDGVALDRPLLDDDPDSADGDGLDAAGRALPEPELEGVAAGRDGTAVGRAGAGREDGVDAGGGVLVTDGIEAVAAELSGRATAGRTRVVSSAAASFGAVDVTCGDASVLIGTVPPPGFCRDVLSDRWLLSELTSSPPCSSSRRGTAM
jgi:hypothetical protein